MSGYDVAVDLIRVYVERGDSIQSLRYGLMGYHSSEISVQIGGYMRSGGKHHSPDWILVNRVDGKDVEEKFKLKDVYDHVRSGQVGLPLQGEQR